MPIYRNASPILEHDTAREGIISPKRHKHAALPAICVMTFFQDALERFLQGHQLPVLATYCSEMGTFPVYGYTHKNTEICLVQAVVGGASIAMMTDYLYGKGVEVLLACGGCGVLEPIPAGDIIVPVCALRDEGASYHYLPPAREISLGGDTLRILMAFLEERKIPYIACKTWTTDGFYRETPDMVAYRRSEGCRVAEMECATMAAIARFRGKRFAQLLYSGDHVTAEDGYEERNWYGNRSVREALFHLLLDAAPSMQPLLLEENNPELEPFEFLRVDDLTDGEIALWLREAKPAEPKKGFVPAYIFDIVRCLDGEPMGRIDLRVGNVPSLYYSGHIGYEVYPPYRGNRLAARATRLVLKLAKRHGMTPVYISCRPSNLPSRRTIESLGATLLEIADTPHDHPLYTQRNEPTMCIFSIEP